MRLGGPVSRGDDPIAWAKRHGELGYRAAYWPLDASAGEDLERAYLRAAADADIVIAEVGAWSNPISRNSTEARAAIEKCCTQLALADRVGARCCVNISGSRGPRWDGPSMDNLTQDTFDLVVETTRAIIDAVRPTRTCYTLEPMPWAFPDSPETYLELVEAIDREQFGVHLDPVNMINSPRRYYGNAEFLRECFRLLGPHIQSVHAKDIVLRDTLTVHLDEVRPGLGALDYAVFLREMTHLDPDTPFMLEHLSAEEEYLLAADYVRAVARSAGVEV
jgi:sugar phosphate isomerase/epimerase